MTVYAPGCRSIIYDNLEQHLQWRTHNNGAQHYTYGVGSWYNTKMARYLQEADVKQLKILQKIKLNESDLGVKVRIEEPYVDIYAYSENKLKELAEWFNDPACVKKVYGPENEISAGLLSENKILRKRKPNFRYKITLKESKFSTATRTAVLNYLQSLGTEVKLPRSIEQQLTKKHEWIWGCYFYADDSRIVTMLQLIDPNIVREVSELVQIDTK